MRIGAHPGVLPASVPAGTDFEKLKWTPGIYDSVSLALADNPLIESVQVAPRIASSEILVETKLRNAGNDAGHVRAEAGGHRRGRAAAPAAAAASHGDARGGRVEDRAADGEARRRAAVDAGGPVPLRARDRDRRRLAAHALRHARVPLRHADAARLPQRQAVLPARLEHHAAPLLRGPRRRALCRGTRRGCASCWSRSRSRCTGTPSASASARCPTSGSTSPTRPAC